MWIEITARPRSSCALEEELYNHHGRKKTNAKLQSTILFMRTDFLFFGPSGHNDLRMSSVAKQTTSFQHATGLSRSKAEPLRGIIQLTARS